MLNGIVLDFAQYNLKNGIISTREQKETRKRKGVALVYGLEEPDS